MADFYVTADGGSEGEVSPVAKAIEAEGFTVETGVTGPDAEALRNNGTVKPPTKLVFIVNGGQAGQTYGSFALDYSDGMCFTIFAFDNYRTHYEETTEAALKEKPLVSEWDSGSFATDEIAQDIEGHTTCSYQNKYPEIFAFVADETSAESLGKRIAHEEYTCGAGDGSGSVVSSGGGAQIKDKTFERCIRRICAATDSVFLVENNAAVLFPYTDWMAFTLREKVQTITPKEIDPEVFSIDYNTEGFYNKVTVAWGGASLPERFPDNELMHEAYVKRQAEKQEKKTETVTQKQGTTQTISADTDGTNLLSEQYDSLVDKYGELEKRLESPVQDLETAQFLVNAYLIQCIRDFNNTCQCRSLANRRYIGGTFYVVTNPFTYEKEMQYLNGYTVRTQKKNPVYFDLDFRYGPESAEELLDYQYATAGSSGAASGGTAGGEAEDINQLAQELTKGLTNEMDKLNAIHDWLRYNITYSAYECSQHNKDPVECLKNKDALNCADTANLSRALFSAAGLQAKVVQGDYHFWTVVTINGHEYASDAVHPTHGIGNVWTQSVDKGVQYSDGGPYYKDCGDTSCC